MRFLVVMAFVAVLPARADTLEDAAQALVDAGLKAWERGDLVAARAQFAHARDVLPDKPNPYRLLALLDAKLGHCSAAVLEADRFVALTTPEDRRRAEVVAVRESCAAEPAQPAVTPPPKAVPAPNSAVRKTVPGRGLRIAAVTSMVVGVAMAAVGGALIGIDGQCEPGGCASKYRTLNGGISLTALGGVGVAVSIPLFVVAYGR